MTHSNPTPALGAPGVSVEPLVHLLLIATRADLTVEEAATALDACMHRRDELGLGGVYAMSEAHVVQLIEGPRVTAQAFVAETRADPQWKEIDVLAETTLLLRWFPVGRTQLRFLSGELTGPYYAALDALASGDRYRAAVLLAEGLLNS